MRCYTAGLGYCVDSRGVRMHSELNRTAAFGYPCEVHPISLIHMDKVMMKSLETYTHPTCRFLGADARGTQSSSPPPAFQKPEDTEQHELWSCHLFSPLGAVRNRQRLTDCSSDFHGSSSRSLVGVNGSNGRFIVRGERLWYRGCRGLSHGQYCYTALLRLPAPRWFS